MAVSTSISQPVTDPYMLGQNPPSYQSQYGNALGFQQQNYQNILGGYQQNQQNIGQGFQGVSQGYGQLGQQVQGTIAGIGASQLQAINDQYAKAQGSQAQALINSGLGNTTVASSMQRGLTLDNQKAQIALANQIAQLQAGYQAQLGSAGLQAQAQGLGLQAQSSNVQQGVLGSQRLPFPSYPPTGQRTTQQSTGGGGGIPISGNPNGGTNGYWAAGIPTNNPVQSSYSTGMPNPFPAQGGVGGYSTLGGLPNSGGVGQGQIGGYDIGNIASNAGSNVVSDMGDYYGSGMGGDTGTSGDSGGWFGDF